MNNKYRIKYKIKGFIGTGVAYHYGKSMKYVEYQFIASMKSAGLDCFIVKIKEVNHKKTSKTKLDKNWK